MEIELVEIQQFLAEHLPFCWLPDESLAQIPEQLDIIYLRRGSEFPPQQNKFYLVRSGAIELCEDDQEVCEQLAEGAIHVCGCPLLNIHTHKQGRTLEDTLLYMGDCQLLYQLSEQHKGFSNFFTASIQERLKDAVATLQPKANNTFLNHQTVRELLRREAVCLDVGESVQAAAQYMSEQGVSALLITEHNKLCGILTDRDLRKRCLALALDYNTPVREVMTPRPHTIKPDTPVDEALLSMARLGVHHLPVYVPGNVIGMFTATDIILNQGGNAALLATRIAKAHNSKDLQESSKQIPILHQQLINSGATAAQLGETLSHMTDAITVRLLQFAEKELGPPPVSYVWMAGGSQGRLEQSSHSDQDNALLISPQMRPEHDEYFAAMAKIVSDGLDACGFVYCPGDAMATNPKWRQPLAQWKGYFHEWINTPEPMALMLSSIFFDLRPVHGEFALFQQLQSDILARAGNNQFFLTFMMSNAIKHRPPIGFFRQFVLVHDGQHNDTLDLKHTGIVPVTDIARILALEGGIREVNTIKRLEQAAGKKLLSQEMAENLQDALSLIAGLRVRHQAKQIAQGIAADNFLDPKELSTLERGHLKDAFMVIKTQQESMMRRYGADNLR
jgi:CBS domain-containing protein